MKDYPSHLVEEIIGWHKFRQLLSSLFPKRKNAIIDLIDSNSCNDSSSSPVELSDSDLFTRNYSSVYKAINQSFNHSKKLQFIQQRKQVHQLIFSTINQEINFPFHLLGLEGDSWDYQQLGNNVAISIFGQQIAQLFNTTVTDANFVFI